MSDSKEKILAIANRFNFRGMTLGFAESCTGGLASALLASQPGVSSFFLGSVVSYARSVKSDVLGVPASLLAVHGEVSEPVARAMARGARQNLKVDWAVAITGIAGPNGGTADKPVGLVHFAVCGPGFEVAERRLFGSQSREDIQRQAALFAFDLLLSAVR
jgi:PncC family amidohydrolase